MKFRKQSGQKKQANECLFCQNKIEAALFKKKKKSIPKLDLKDHNKCGTHLNPL